jgi:hypothetical protein
MTRAVLDNPSRPTTGVRRRKKKRKQKNKSHRSDKKNMDNIYVLIRINKMFHVAYFPTIQQSPHSKRTKIEKTMRSCSITS